MMFSRSAKGVSNAFGAAGLLATALLLAPAASAEAAPDNPVATLSAATEQCLTCHSMPALSKTMGDGGKISLHVSRDDYSGSVHGVMGCRGCHRDVDPGQHPQMRQLASAREFTLEATGACRNCHADKYRQYEGSIHASLVAAGDVAAPVCASCHDAHSIRRMDTYEPASGQPCKACHEEIFDAYAGSVHGKALVEDGKSQAPFCTDCHQAHDVTAVAAGDRLKQACLSCHDGAPLAHKKWLPNAARHLESVACPACHSPMAERSVDLRLYDTATRELVAAPPGFEERVAAIDTADDGLDPFELWALVSDTNAVERERKLALRGRLEVSNGAQAHQLAFKQEAVRNCNTCHTLGAEPYDRVTVSVSDPDGRRTRYAAGEEALTSAVSVGSVGGFYTAGGTRIKLLDALLVLGILAGLGIPLTHWTLRRLSRKKG